MTTPTPLQRFYNSSEAVIIAIHRRDRAKAAVTLSDAAWTSISDLLNTAYSIPVNDVYNRVVEAHQHLMVLLEIEEIALTEAKSSQKATKEDALAAGNTLSDLYA